MFMAIRAMIGFAVLVCTVSVQAQVVLENTIKKIVTYVDDNGQVQRRMVDATSVVPGDELQYQVRFSNRGDQPVDAGTIVITDAIPEHTHYIPGTAFGAGAAVVFSADGERFAEPDDLLIQRDGRQVAAAAEDYAAIRWTFAPSLEPGESGYVSFNVRLK